jgi:hypothetical protein
MNKIRTTALLTAAAVGALLLSGAPALSKSGTPLTGTLDLTAGKVVTVHGKPEYTGTYFRMLEPGGTDVYFSNGSSTAKDHTYTLLRPGTHGGLELGKYQPAPSPAFSSHGFALAKRIVQPQSFESINFSISTAARDAQSGARVSAPSLILNGTKLTGNFSAWTAEWNKIYFNQGAPKPNGSYPGLTRPVTGTYNSKTHAFTITWYSEIVGGPFNDFTGFWHLQGHLKP